MRSTLTPPNFFDAEPEDARGRVGPDSDDETRAGDIEAHIQPDAGYFAIETPIYEGDIVELPDPEEGCSDVTW